MGDRIGQQIGNYRITRLLGEGGFAEVYLGEHIHLGTEAAIKILHTQLTSDDTEQFRAEARLIARLEHPHIVRVLDFGLDGKTPYLVMSYAPNGTLRQLHQRRIPVPLPTILTYVQQVADALQYAHNERLIHRDVKPENMLVGRRHEILLSDFGIALVTQSSRYQGTRDVVGTVAYMAPEQIQGKPRPASDQYALGVVVYEWLTGERPFHGSFTEVAVQHAVATPPPLREKLPSISPYVEQVVLTTLAKDPMQRFATIQAFANALEQASKSTGQPIFVTPPSPPLQSPTPSNYPGETSQPTIAATQQQFSSPTVASGEIRASRPLFSRRAVLIGAVGLAALAGGGIAWAALNLKSGANPVSNVTPTTTAGTPIASTTVTTPATTPTVSAPSPTVTSPPVGPIITATPLSVYHGHSNIVYGVTWASTDEQRLASAGLDNTVQDWNRSNNQLNFSYSHNAEVNDVKASPDKGYIASASDDKTAKIYDASGNYHQTYTGHSAQVNTLVWSNNGMRIVTASTDKSAHVWDPTSGATLQMMVGHTGTVWAADWSPDGQYVVTASADHTAIVWNASTGAKVIQYTGHTNDVRSVSWSPDSSQIATASHDGTVQIWDAFTASLIRTYTGHSDQLRTVAWSHDGTRIVSGGEDKTARIWEASTGKTLLIYQGHSSTVFDAQWSPDDTLIASGGTDKTVQIWQAR